MKKNVFTGRRKFLFGATSIALGGLFFGYRALSKNSTSSQQAITKAPPKPNARLGINLSGIAYWGTEFPFVNLMHQSSEWVSQPPNREWGKGPTLKLDKHGWVTQLEPGCSATKIICSDDVGPLPSQEYLILYDGEGELKLSSHGDMRLNSDGNLAIKIKGSHLAIDLIKTNPKNPLRNIRIVEPQFLTTYQSNPWHPEFLARWQGIANIRFMDWMVTNNSNQMHWADRPQLNDATFAEKGVPAELLIDLANRLNTDPWFCMPHQANDDYIKQFANLVKNNLNPTLKAWVEYSNEVWNGGFEQFRYASKQGQALKLGSNEWESAYHYNARRSVEIFNIWQTTFVDNNRMVKVTASQGANSYLSEQLLKLPEVADLADVLAIAPYVSLNVPSEADEADISASKVASWPLEKLFEYVNNVALPESKNWIAASKKIADTHGLTLVAYEAGQHLVGIQGAENNKKLTKLFLKANADKRMGDIYAQHLQHWQQEGGDLMCMFNSVGGWSKWGSWGLLEHYKQTATDSPKFKATMEWAKSRGQAVKY